MEQKTKQGVKMKQEKTNRNCESCRTEIKVLDLCQEPNLILCELCKPWVLSSIYQVPRQVIGIDIEDPSLFRTSLRLTENLKSPSTEYAWYKFLKFIFYCLRKVITYKPILSCDPYFQAIMV